MTTDDYAVFIEVTKEEVQACRRLQDLERMLDGKFSAARQELNARLLKEALSEELA